MDELDHPHHADHAHAPRDAQHARHLAHAEQLHACDQVEELVRHIAADDDHVQDEPAAQVRAGDAANPHLDAPVWHVVPHPEAEDQVHNPKRCCDPVGDRQRQGHHVVEDHNDAQDLPNEPAGILRRKDEESDATLVRDHIAEPAFCLGSPKHTLGGRSLRRLQCHRDTIRSERRHLPHRDEFGHGHPHRIFLGDGDIQHSTFSRRAGQALTPRDDSTTIAKHWRLDAGDVHLSIFSRRAGQPLKPSNDGAKLAKRWRLGAGDVHHLIFSSGCAKPLRPRNDGAELAKGWRLGDLNGDVCLLLRRHLLRAHAPGQERGEGGIFSAPSGGNDV
mmetsp:Transcript_3537/g.12934  ORF Transcript_3537/g.12934 Transcript_3537/m.12934 type:complete len:332 (-) Transcript_3537:204-1199(-)